MSKMAIFAPVPNNPFQMKSRTLFAAMFLLAGYIQQVQGQAEIRRVEPAFWWAGMKNPNLQLLVYGPQISELTPVVSHPGVSVKQTIRLENPNYLFIDLDLSGAKPGAFDIGFQQKGKTVRSYTYRLLEREKSSSLRKGFDPTDVMYLITPDRFANGDPSNDNMEGMHERLNRTFKGGRHGGDIKGIADHLDYIAGMGFTAIWLNPLLENNMKEYSYHGYSTTDFYKVDPRYGSNEDYVDLIRKAHSKNIRIIMDMILNHCGSEHWWMKDLPSKDWINYDGKFAPTSHRMEVVLDPYASAADKKMYTDGWFVETMPDMNQRNPLMATYLIQNTIWWIEYSGLDGIRMDTYPYPDAGFMSDWTKAVLEEYPHFNMVGEVWNANPAIVSYWQRGKINSDGYVSYLPSLMDFPVQETLGKALPQKETRYDSGLILLYRIMVNDFLYPDAANLVVFPDNHDMDRFYTRVGENLNWFKQGVLFLLTTRGIPQIYYGSEALMTNAPSGDHGSIRSDFPGGWQGDKVNAFTGQGLSKEAAETQQWMKKLLTWRKTASAVHYGKLLQFVPEDGVYVFFRYDEKQKVMVIVNKNEQPYSLKLDRFAEALQGATQAYDVLGGKPVSLQSGALALQPGQGLLLEIK